MKLRVKIEDQTYEVEVGDLSARPILASVDGETFEVWPEEAQSTAPVQLTRPAAVPVAAPVARQAAPAGNVDRSKAVTAPIPGTIVGIAVNEGDSVTPGQELCSLEAMKMKNSIRSTRNGKIGKILVKAGDRVSQGQPLVEYAE
jgi:glutaconyl-CoA/methylmalonyl-CoA decarboxylase subunit gamma